MDLGSALLEGLSLTFGVKFLLSPVYLSATVLIVWAIWLYRGKPVGFWRFMLPRELYVHPSTMVDLKVGLFNTLFTATGAISVLFVTPYVTIAVLEQLGGRMAASGGVWAGVAAAALLFLTQDFCRYWNHYLHHETKVLWPFHAVHHSAEVMTPLTFLRAHPMYSALQALMISALVGVMQALVLWALVGEIEPWAIYAGTLAFNTYIFFGAHLRHSHIWVSYGRVMEHILISPAQHQVHHSSNPKHHDKNYGEVFAIWDWMFGTLYVPAGYEKLEYGLADRNGNKIPQKHPTLKDALVGPFVEVWEEIIKGTSIAVNKEPEA